MIWILFGLLFGLQHRLDLPGAPATQHVRRAHAVEATLLEEPSPPTHTAIDPNGTPP